MSSKVEETIVDQIGIISKITSFISTKKGLYLIGAIVLVGIIYYYTTFGKNNKNINNIDTQNLEENIPQPPPGYVTIPVEMLEGLQQGNQYQQMPQNFNQPIDLQTQQQIEIHEQHEQQDQQMETQNQQRVPKLKHNKQLQDEEEEEEIAEQDLSKEEMESIQAQLQAMQQQRGNNNNA